MFLRNRFPSKKPKYCVGVYRKYYINHVLLSYYLLLAGYRKLLEQNQNAHFHNRLPLQQLALANFTSLDKSSSTKRLCIVVNEWFV